MTEHPVLRSSSAALRIRAFGGEPIEVFFVPRTRGFTGTAGGTREKHFNPSASVLDRTRRYMMVSREPLREAVSRLGFGHDTISDSCSLRGSDSELTLAHVINPVKVSQGSDLYTAQPIVFESLRTAQSIAARSMHVDLFCSVYPEDRVMVEPGFKLTHDLDRSLSDVAGVRVEKKLPLIGDILYRLYEATVAEYLIYTNVDIAVMPHFYLTVRDFIEQGYDAFTITRRVISGEFTDREQLPLMYSVIGTEHPGFDCFVFHRDLCPNLHLPDICVGAPGIGMALLANFALHANKLGVFMNEHLTFHVGADGAWERGKLRHAHNAINIANTIRLISELKPNATSNERKELLGIFLGILTRMAGQNRKGLKAQMRDLFRVCVMNPVCRAMRW